MPPHEPTRPAVTLAGWSTGLTWGLFPLLLAQGAWVRRRMPKLQPAPGPTCGQTGPDPRVRVLVLGESPVAGLGLPSLADSVTGHLASALARDLDCQVRWQALGQNGLTATGARALLPEADPCEAAVVALGVNDTLRGRNPRRWAADLSTLITDLRGQVGPVPVWLTGVPPLGSFPSLPQPLRAALGWRAAALQDALLEVAHHAPDTTAVPLPLSLEAEMFADDAFHPSVEAHALWGHQLASVVRVGLEYRALGTDPTGG